METAREETVRGGMVEKQGSSPKKVKLSLEAAGEVRRRWGRREDLTAKEEGEVTEFVLADLERQADEAESREGPVRESEPVKEEEELPKAA